MNAHWSLLEIVFEAQDFSLLPQPLVPRRHFFPPLLLPVPDLRRTKILRSIHFLLSQYYTSLRIITIAGWNLQVLQCLSNKRSKDQWKILYKQETTTCTWLVGWRHESRMLAGICGPIKRQVNNGERRFRLLFNAIFSTFLHSILKIFANLEDLNSIGLFKVANFIFQTHDFHRSSTLSRKCQSSH